MTYRKTNLAVHAVIFLSLLGLAACNQMDPLTKDYVWIPSDVNKSNIQAMVANPNDLIHGRSTTTRQALGDADAVARVWEGRTTPLLKETAGSMTSQSGQGATGTTNGGGGT